MGNPVVKKDLVDSILDLRAEAEQSLMRNKYYIAILKLDELLEIIRPLEAELIGEERGERTALTNASSKPDDDTDDREVERDELGDEPDAQMLADEDDEHEPGRYSEDAA